MSRLMKAFVGGACLLAGLMLLAYWSTFIQRRPGLGDAQPAGIASATGARLEKSKPAEGGQSQREKPPANDGQELTETEAVKRPADASMPADPNELKVRPDENGMLAFSFNGQTWPAVFEWLADISEMSLLWEEAPTGAFTYATRKPCTVDEVRDKINSVLLGKGFTLLRSGQVLIAANLKDFDASLAPRVRVDELAKRDKHEFVKTFVTLDWMAAESAAAEIIPLLGPYGRVAALKAGNRLELFDMTVNLEQIIDLIDEEQSGDGQQKLVEEFRLKHKRTAEVLEILRTLLGIEPKDDQPADPQAIMAAQMLKQRAQPADQPDSSPAPEESEKEPQVNLAANSRANSILAHAPPDKMALIRRAISIVDVPQYAAGRPSTGIERMQIYRVAGISPEVLVKLLQEVAVLDPTTRLEIDQKNGTIMAFAPHADHVLIRSLVDRVDGKGRRFEVIQLRLLSAEYVAGSIDLLMNGVEKTDAGRDRFLFDDYEYFNNAGSSPQQDAANRFRVEADIERNRLLLLVNEVELADIKALLAKLGEIAPEERNGFAIRLIPAAPGEETDRLLERLQKIWPAVAPNPLEVLLDAADSADAPPKPRVKRPSSKTPSAGEQDGQP